MLVKNGGPLLVKTDKAAIVLDPLGTDSCLFWT